VATRTTNRTTSKKAARPKAKSSTTRSARPKKGVGAKTSAAKGVQRAPAKRPRKAQAKKKVVRTSTARAVDASIEALLAPTATIYAQEELEILSVALKHPALGGAFVQRWAKRDRVGIPKRDLAAFKEAMATVDVEARVRSVVRKLAKTWATKLDPETIAGVREDIQAMYRGE
jgi:hypothetical protein